MKHFEIPFEEILVKLDLPTTAAEIAKFSPSGKVPALIDGDLCIWESLAIMEYLNEKFPDRGVYPKDKSARAYARAIANEMHGGFAKLRSNLSYNLKRKVQNFDLTPALQDINRIKEIWTTALAKSGGPFLFGSFSVADAMYAPVIGRFSVYKVPVEGKVAEYCRNIENLPALKEWYAGAYAEDFVAPLHD